MSQADELIKWKELLESGAITQEEYDAMKTKILSAGKDTTKESTGNVTQQPIQQATYQSSVYGNTGGNTTGNVNNQFDGKPAFKSRKGMLILSIVCLLFTVIYLTKIPSVGVSMFGMTVLFGILTFMFFKLSRVPKAYKHIGKNDKGMRKSIFVIICVAIGIVVGAGTSGSSKTTSTSTQTITENNTEENNTEENNDTTTTAEESTSAEPSVDLANDFEKSLYDAVTNNGGNVISVDLEEASENNDQTACEYVEFNCENNEEVVQKILNSLVEAQKADKSSAVCAVVKEEEDSASNLVIADIDIEGNLTMTYESPNYNSARNVWISSQFSAWDGSHTELTNLIKKSLNDEKSYKHINTTYRDIKTQEDADEVNKVLSDANYTARVEVGDLFIMTEFSAKNAFNATIKSTAFGVASYNNNSITLIGIE